MPGAATVDRGAGASTGDRGEGAPADERGDGCGGDGDEGEAALAIELGFARLPFGASGAVAATAQGWPRHCSDWPDGQLGGRPHWLVPARLPPPAALRCETCLRPMALLCQLYCPVSRARCGHGGAFHRMLYVFCCTQARCSNVPGLTGATTPADPAAPTCAHAPTPASAAPSMRVFRVQLPRRNPFLPPPRSDNDGVCDCDSDRNGRSEDGVGEGDEEDEREPLESAAADAASGRLQFDADAQSLPRDELCVLCGCAAPARCGRCRGPRYCGRDHQALHWRNGHKEACAAASAASSPYASGAGSAVASADSTRAALLAGACLPAWELVVDSEPPRAERARQAEASLPPGVRQRLENIRAGRAGALDAELEGGADAQVLLPKSLRRVAPPGKSAGAVAAQLGAEDASPGDEPEGSLRALSLRGLTQQQLVAATGAALFADATLRYFQQRVACEPAQVVRYCLWPPDEEEEGEGKEKGTGNGPQGSWAPAASAVADDGADDESELGDGAGGEPRGAPLWFLQDHQPPRRPRLRPRAAADSDAAAEGEGPGAASGTSASAREGAHAQARDRAEGVPPCARCGSARRFEFQVLPQALSFLLPGGRASVSATGPSGREAVDLDFGTVAVYTCARSCRGALAAPAADASAADTAAAASSSDGRAPRGAWGAYVEEEAWVQPAGEEQLRVPEAAAAEAQQEQAEAAAATAKAAKAAKAAAPGRA